MKLVGVWDTCRSLKQSIPIVSQQFPPDIDRNAIFPVSDPIVDARGFVVDPIVTRNFMTKFWSNASIAFKKIENGLLKKLMKSAHPSLHVHGRKTLKRIILLCMTK
jgi:hypothetical protein